MNGFIVSLMQAQVATYPKVLVENTEDGLALKCPVCGELCHRAEDGEGWRWVEYGYHRVDATYSTDNDGTIVTMQAFADLGRKDDGDVGWLECAQGHRMLSTENVEIDY